MNRFAFALALNVLVGIAPGIAAADLSSNLRFDIPAQPLPSALLKYSAQSGVQVASLGDTVEGRTASDVVGTFVARAALDRLLSGTGLVYEVIDSGSVAIRVGGSRGSSSTRAASADTQSRGEAPAPARSFWDRFRIARADTTEPAASVMAADEGEARKLAPIEEVVITGSRLSAVGVKGPVPVNIYTSEDVKRSGQSTVADFLNTLPEISSGSPENGETQSGATTVSLRGLPIGATLVLLNGRRVEAAALTYAQGPYFDLNNIPAAAIDRIEVVPQGSSAIYGSDALAGVVNIILRKDFDGFEANARYGGASGYREGSTDVAWGKTWSRGSVSMLGSFYDRGTLNSSERKITSDNAYGVVAAQCNPGNVSSTDGSNLPGLEAPSAGVASGVHSSPSLSDFSAGNLNLCRRSYSSDLVPPARRSTAYVTGEYRVLSSVELFSELMYTHQMQDFSQGHLRLTRVRLPQSNAYNPFGEDVRVDYRFSVPQAEDANDNDIGFSRILAGLRGKFAQGWNWELAAWQARDDVDMNWSAYYQDSANLAAALASSDPATALNLFTAGAPASDAVLSSIYSPVPLTLIGTNRVINGFVRGTLAQLPAGALSAVLGAEYSRSEMEVQWNFPGYEIYGWDYARRATSLYTELRVPLLANSAHPETGDVLALTGALRHEHYSDSGSRLVPQYALEWRPLRSLLVRASYAEAFKAPKLYDLYAAPYASPGYCCVFDPKHNNESVTFTLLSGGNPQLRPETGDSRSLGVVWSPVEIPSLSVEATWWQVNQRDRAASLSGQGIVDYEALFSDHVTRDPVTGLIQSVDLSSVNFGELNVAGIDLQLSYRWRTRLGDLTPLLAATKTYKFDAALIPGAPAVDRLNHPGDSEGWAPSLKSTLALSWALGPYSARIAGRYVHGYSDYPDLGATTRTLGDFWLWDLSGQYEAGRALAPGKSYLRNATVRLSVVNLFDPLPKYSAFSYGTAGYDPSQYDIRGRFVSLSVGTRF